MADAIVCSNLLEENGCIIFDDYGSPTNDFEIRKTINTFLAMLEPSKWRIAGSWYQLFLRKSFNPNRTDIFDLEI
jgi:hypothetical protein